MQEDDSNSVKNRQLLNALMKGVLFVQDMHDPNWNLIDTFHQQFPDKYDFMFRRGAPSDTVIFQGSAAEGLVVYGIEERDPEAYWYGLRYCRQFDYDVMTVKNDIVVLDEESQYVPAVTYYLNAHINEGLDSEEALKMWTEANFCFHDKEPLIMTTINDFSNFFGVVDHVILVQPACKECENKEPFGKTKNEDYMGRKYNLKTPYEFWIDFSSKSYKHPDEKHSCDAVGEGNINFNRYGDLCHLCRDLNSTTFKHDNGSQTHIFLDKVFKEGPSSMNRFYMNHEGEPQYGLPLFGECGVSTLDVDNIAALRYPLLDWMHFGETLRGFGIDMKPESYFFRWPYGCNRFTFPHTKSDWPTLELRLKVLKEGCHLVPRFPMKYGQKGPATYLRQAMIPMTMAPAWRVSFSLSEKILAKSFTLPQRRCFLLVKVLLTIQTIWVHRKLQGAFGEDSDDWNQCIKEAKFSVSSFILKHVMFWTLEEVDQSEWRMNNLYNCVKHVLVKFEAFLKEKCVPHYFFGYKKNLLAGDIQMDKRDHRKMTIKCLNMIIHIRHLRANIFPALICCMRDELFDYQWTNDNPDLLKSFCELVKAFKNNNEYDETLFNSAVIEHHQTMIHQIKDAPRKYILAWN